MTPTSCHFIKYTKKEIPKPRYIVLHTTTLIYMCVKHFNVDVNQNYYDFPYFCDLVCEFRYAEMPVFHESSTGLWQSKKFLFCIALHVLVLIFCHKTWILNSFVHHTAYQKKFWFVLCDWLPIILYSLLEHVVTKLILETNQKYSDIPTF